MHPFQTWTIPKEAISTASRFDAKFFHPQFHGIIEKLRKSSVRLGELSRPERGKAPYKPEYVKEGIPVVKTDDLTSKGIRWENVAFINVELYRNKYKGHELMEGDILLSSTGTGSIGKVDIVGFIPPEFKQTALITPKITLIRIEQDKFDTYFLAQYLRSSYAQIQIESMTRGQTGQIELYPQDIQNILIPLLAEEVRREIGDKVKKAEEVRKEAWDIRRQILSWEQELFRTEENKALTWVIPPRLLSQRLDAKFYNPTKLEVINRIKSLWSAVRLVDLCEDGFPKRGNAPHKPQYTTYGIPTLVTDSLTNQGIDWDKVAFVSEEEFESKKGSSVRQRDLILASTGVGSLGKVDIVHRIPEEYRGRCLTTPELTIIRLKDKEISYFLLLFLRSPFGQIQIMSSLRGETGQTHLYPKDIQEVLIPLIGEQEEIANKVVVFEELQTKSKRLIKEASQTIGKALEEL